MGMTRKQKEAEIIALGERFANDEVVVVAEYSGLTVKELEAFRGLLRAEGASFKVTKNTLAKIAIKGTKFEAIEDMFSVRSVLQHRKTPSPLPALRKNLQRAMKILKSLGVL